MEKESNSIGMYLVAALAGVAIGMAIAPAKGSETRAKLLNKTKNFAGQFPPVRLIKRLAKDKHEREVFLSNVHSASNPVEA
jgi:gas vesicle protein